VTCFLSCRLRFKVGDQPANNFRMIEIHYFKVVPMWMMMVVQMLAFKPISCMPAPRGTFQRPVQLLEGYMQGSEPHQAWVQICCLCSEPQLFCTPQDKVVRVYDFTFGFCIPNSTNSWEAIYDVPKYTSSQVTDYVGWGWGLS